MIPLNYSNSSSFLFPKELLNSRNSFNLYEYRAFYFIIRDLVGYHGTPGSVSLKNKLVCFNYVEYAKEVSPTTTTHLIKAINNLCLKNVEVKLRNKTISFPVIDSIVEFKRGEVNVKFNSRFLKLIKGSTDSVLFKFFDLIRFRTTGGLKLNELFQLHPIHREFKTQDLRWYFNCENKYPETANFMRMIVVPALNNYQRVCSDIHRVEKVMLNHKLISINIF